MWALNDLSAGGMLMFSGLRNLVEWERISAIDPSGMSRFTTVLLRLILTVFHEAYVRSAILFVP